MWEIVIGLETHVELSTKTKIFCACTTQFGGDPNTHCCEGCTGQPGTLPALNKSVVEYAATAGLALGCDVNNISIMSRKHYVYPDLAKSYQISQFDKPLCENGCVTLESGHKIRVNRIHIEEDAGKLVHSGGAVLMDDNRAGMPLIEIVTEPDFRSAAQVVEYLETLQTVLRAIGVSDCRMQEGSMRCDVNISLRPEGSDKFGTRVEIKNMNSFVSASAAIDYEFRRQREILESGGEVVQETRGFNADTGETIGQRDKEDANDYRYFPEPDIGPVYISDEDIARLRAALPELPAQKLLRYVNELGLPESDARLITKYSKVSEYFERACESANAPKTVGSFMITQMFSMITTEAERENWSPKTTAQQLGELVALIESGKLNRNLAKRVFSQMLESGAAAADFISEEDMAGFSDDTLRELCQKAIEQNEKSAADYRAGKEKALKALVGAVMRESRGRADAIKAEQMLKDIIGG